MLTTETEVTTMTRSTQHFGQYATLPDSGSCDTRAPLRIALRLWGIDEATAQFWLDDLPTLGGLVSWEIAVDRRATGADVVVHLVKPAANSEFCWNCVGANAALKRPASTYGMELALFAGDTIAMPVERAGHWVAAGAFSPFAALFRLTHLLAAVAVPQSPATVRVRGKLLAMISTQLDAA
jgi:hypothetical protein